MPYIHLTIEESPQFNYLKNFLKNSVKKQHIKLKENEEIMKSRNWWNKKQTHSHVTTNIKISNIFIIPKVSPHSFIVSPSSPSHWQPRIHFLFLSFWYCIGIMVYKLLNPASLIQHNSFGTHLHYYMYWYFVPFYYLVNSILWIYHCWFIHSSVEGHWCLQFLVIKN